MKMKREIKTLLDSESGIWKINEAFELKRWTKDSLGEDVDVLELEMIPVNNGRRNFFHRRIVARDTQGIMDEVAEAMDSIMKEYTVQLAKRWRGGLN